MDLKYEIYIAGTLEQVWKILIAPENVKKIYYGSVIKSTFQIGDPLEYVGPGSDGDQTVHIYGKVLEFEPQKVFSFSHYTGKTYNPESDLYESRVSYHLEQAGEATKLTLIHDRWKLDDPSYKGSQDAWPMILSNIKSWVETGRTINIG